MKNLILIILFCLAVALGGCGRKSLVYHGGTNEYKATPLVGSKTYDKQQRLRAQHNARRASRL